MKYTEGIAFDGTAILKNGQAITISEILKGLNSNDTLLNKLEKLFDKYHKKQLKLSDTPNSDYYLFMGKANAIGEIIDLIKK